MLPRQRKRYRHVQVLLHARVRVRIHVLFLDVNSDIVGKMDSRNHETDCVWKRFAVM